jgi:hypothetical protein
VNPCLKNIMYSMNENGKMRPVETILRRGGRDKGK